MSLVIRWSPNNEFVASGSADGSLGMWGFPGGNAVFFNANAHSNWVCDLLFEKSGERIFTSGGMERPSLKIWSTKGNFLALSMVCLLIRQT